jgi:hypothetical protein
VTGGVRSTPEACLDYAKQAGPQNSQRTIAASINTDMAKLHTRNSPTTIADPADRAVRSRPRGAGT